METRPYVDVRDWFVSNRDEVIIEGFVIDGNHRVEFGALTDGKTVDLRLNSLEISPRQYQAICSVAKSYWLKRNKEE